MGNKINAWYARIMCRPGLYKFHKKLWAIGLRGMGFMNFLDYTVTGEKGALKYFMGNKNYGRKPVIFDVGGNFGTWSIMAVALVPRAKVYAFEPIKETFEEMEKNLEYFDVNCYNLVIGERRGEIEISYSDPGKGQILHTEIKNPGRSHLKKKEKVVIETIDRFCEKNKIEKIDYLKMDIEGYEYKALLGAQKMIKEKKIDYIQFEIGEDNIFNKKTLHDFQRLIPGYTMYRMLTHGAVLIDLNSAEASTYLLQNIVAIKNELEKKLV